MGSSEEAPKKMCECITPVKMPFVNWCAICGKDLPSEPPDW